MLTIAQATSDTEIEAARELLREYTAWALSIEPDSIQAPTFQRLDEELDSLPGEYAPPAGRLLMATEYGQPAGCICLKPRNSSTCELKRLYVQPKFRGLGLGGQLVERLIDEARQAGY